MTTSPFSARKLVGLLAQVHPDTPALRRYMVDDDHLSRADGEYWRTGGSYEPEPDA